MKILATSCWHIGLETGGYSRADEIGELAKELIDESYNADLFVHLGDLFDNDHPRPGDYALAFALLRQIECEAKVLVAGNHDPTAVVPIGVALDGWKVVHEDPAVFDVHGDAADGRYVCIPYQSAFTEIVESVKLARTAGDVVAVFSHLDVPGASLSSGVEMGDSEHALPPDAKDLPCWVVNGHIHKRQIMGSIIMPGSLIQVNQGESGESKGFVMLRTG